MIHGWSAFGGPTMRSTPSNWQDALSLWLKPFLDRLGHKARRQMCPLYVTGLIGPGDRKSIQPMAERLAPGDQLYKLQRKPQLAQALAGRFDLSALRKAR